MIKKYNELFGSSKIASSIQSDINSALIRSFINNAKNSKFLSISSSEDHEICNNFTDAVDFILDRSKIDGLKVIKNIDDFYIHELDSFEDYGYTNIYIGINKTDSEKHLLVFVNDDKHPIRGWKRLIMNPTYLVGMIVKIKN